MVKIYVCKTTEHQHASKKDKEACLRKNYRQFKSSKRSLPEAVEKISTEASTTKDICIKSAAKIVEIIVSDSDTSDD